MISLIAHLSTKQCSVRNMSYVLRQNLIQWVLQPSTSLGKGLKCWSWVLFNRSAGSVTEMTGAQKYYYFYILPDSSQFRRFYLRPSVRQKVFNLHL